MTNPSIGLIGPGAMGLGITRALIRGGFPVFTRDVDPARDALARAAGATVCASPADVARHAAIVITVVVDAAQTDEVCFGTDGLAGALPDGGIVVLCSTVGPDYAGALGARLAARGITLIDAPISGGPARAAAGTMSMMIAGPRAALERCAGAFTAMSDKRFVISERAGDGSRMKLVNNLMAAINLVGAAEAFALGIRAGLDPEKIHEVVMASSGASWMAGDRMGRVLAGDRTVTAAAPILTKDVSLALELGRSLRFPLPQGSAAHQALLATLGLGFDAEDDAWVIRVYQALSGIRLPGEEPH
ncbi:MAG: NAD(P)-dependent oxidoreductase [Burkholderiales bacterium]|nr:NAD(P)-dependent oxidoreductase [Burkholderiales bacterium]